MCSVATCAEEEDEDTQTHRHAIRIQNCPHQKRCQAPNFTCEGLGCACVYVVVSVCLCV